MATCKSIRDFHSQIEDIRCGLDAIFSLAVHDHEPVCNATAPVMAQLLDVLQAADPLCGPDDPVEPWSPFAST
jgi:hypothetical protein